MSWAVVGVMCAVVLANFEDFKSLTSGMLGLVKPAERETATQRQTAYRNTPATSFGDTVRLQAGRNGHFVAPADINGREIKVVVDTGASHVALTYEDAERAGIYVSPSDFTARSRTANGIAKSAPVMIDEIEIGGIAVRNVQGSVSEPGRLHVTLLGMSFLSRLKRFEMRRGQLIMQN